MRLIHLAPVSARALPLLMDGESPFPVGGKRVDVELPYYRLLLLDRSISVTSRTPQKDVKYVKELIGDDPEIIEIKDETSSEGAAPADNQEDDK